MQARRCGHELWALSLLGAACFVAGGADGQPARQPEVVCDLTPVLVASIEAGKLRSAELIRENAEPIRLTFRNIDPQAGTAKMLVGQGASGEMPVAVTVDDGAITYLLERAGSSKTIVTTGNKPTAEGWPAVMSQHGSGSGEITIRAASGICRMRAR